MLDLRTQTICPFCLEPTTVLNLICETCGIKRQTHVNYAGEFLHTHYVTKPRGEPLCSIHSP